jgi:hypothetical protein
MTNAGPHSVEVETTEHLGALHPDAVRVIEVPFKCQRTVQLSVGSISNTLPLSMPPGSFLLRCEFLQSAGNASERMRLVFARKDVSHFAVLRADESLSTVSQLLTTAQAAPG